MNSSITYRLVIVYILVICRCYFVNCTDGSPPTTTTTSQGKSETGNRTPVQLNVKSLKGTDNVEYTDNGSCHIYVAKKGYGFKKVKGQKKMIWETGDSKEYAVRVLYFPGDKTVTITLGDGKTKEFTKTSSSCCCRSNDWTELDLVKKAETTTTNQSSTKA